MFDEKKRTAPYAGGYTLTIAGQQGGGNLPGGEGYGVVTVSKAGAISLSGALADGTKLSQSAFISTAGLWPLYVPLYDGHGSVLSWVTFTNATVLGGDLLWTRPAVGTVYPSGFEWMTRVLGASYVAPAKGLNAWGGTNSPLVLTMEGGDLAEPVVNRFWLDTKNLVKNPSLTNKLVLTLTASSGLFSGSQSLPGSKKPVTFNGVILQNATNGQGYFLGTSQSGRVTLRCADSVPETGPGHAAKR